MLVDSRGYVCQTYCHMQTLCSSGGGRIRVAYLNMTDSSEKCPNIFILYNENGVQVQGLTS